MALRVGKSAAPNLIMRKRRRIDRGVCAAPACWRKCGRPRQRDNLAGHDALTLSLSGMRPGRRFKVNGKQQSVAVRSRRDATGPSPSVQQE